MSDSKDLYRARKRENDKAYRERNRDKIRARQSARKAALRAARRAATPAKEKPLRNLRGRPGAVKLPDKVAAVREACRHINRNPNIDQLTKYRAVQAAVASFDHGDDFWTLGAVDRLTSEQWVNKFIKAAM